MTRRSLFGLVAGPLVHRKEAPSSCWETFESACLVFDLAQQCWQDKNIEGHRHLARIYRRLRERFALETGGCTST